MTHVTVNQIDKRFNFHPFNARMWYIFLKNAVWNEICWLFWGDI